MLSLSQSVFAIDTIDAIDTATTVSQDQVLLQLSDLPGVNTGLALAPGVSAGKAGPIDAVTSTRRVHPSSQTHVPALGARRQSGPQLSQQFQGVASTGLGAPTLNKIPWSGLTIPGTNTLASAGIGFNWIDDDNFVVKVNYAFKPAGQTITPATGKSSRIWLQAFISF